MMNLLAFVATMLLCACTGPVGPVGPPGADGIDGNDGMDGENGRDGIDGQNGEDGTDGRDGMDGQDGEDGKDGENGKDGEDVTALSVWLTCSVDLDLIGDSRKETSFSYTTIFYSNGDVEVECDTRLGSAQDDFSHSYYPSVVNGAQSGYCSAASDYPPDDLTAGIWAFSFDEGGPKATYHDDPAHPMNGNYYEFVNDDCFANVANSDGSWSRAELHDVF